MPRRHVLPGGLPRACFLLLLALPGCSGGGGPSAPETLFAILSISPGHGSAGIAPGAAVRVTFTRPVNRASLNEQTFGVGRVQTGGANVPTAGVISFADGDRVAVFTPTGSLGNNAAYLVTVAAAVQPATGSAAGFLGASATFVTLRASAVANDPAGDVFGGASSPGLVLPDVVSLTATQESAELVIRMEFASSVSPDRTSPNAIVGLLEFDIDQRTPTGFPSLIDSFRPGIGTTALGVEFAAFLGGGSASVLDIFRDVEVDVPLTITGNVVTLRIPYGLLGNDDGNVNLALVIGTVQEPTDIVPNQGHLNVGVSPGRPATAIAPSALPVVHAGAYRRAWGSTAP